MQEANPLAVVPRRLKIGHRGATRAPFAWRHAREIFDPAPSYYLIFLFGFYFGYTLIIFFMVVSSFGGTTRGLLFRMDWFAGSESVNYFTDDFILVDRSVARFLEASGASSGEVLQVHIVRGGSMEINGSRVSDMEVAKILRSSGADVVIAIRVEPDATYADFVRLLDIVAEHHPPRPDSDGRDNLIVLPRLGPQPQPDLSQNP
jgi:hypothetical protein